VLIPRRLVNALYVAVLHRQSRVREAKHDVSLPGPGFQLSEETRSTPERACRKLLGKFRFNEMPNTKNLGFM
jgi:hypothetical protein